MRLKWTKGVVLSAVLALSVSACSTGGNAPASNNSSGSGAKTASVPGDPLGKYDQGIDVSYARSTRSDITFPKGDSYDNNVWTRLIKDELGINLKISWSADGQTDAFKNKMNVSMASGQLPDLVQGDYNFIATASGAGLLADLTDAYNNYASPELKKLIASNPGYLENATIDGKLVAIPFVSDPVELNSTILWIRDDWMKALNLSAPKSFDDVVKIATAFAKNDPDGNGKPDTVGLGVQQKLITPDFGDIGGVASAYGALAILDGMWYRDASGKVVYGTIQPEMKNALAELQSMYKDGLIDKEFGVKDTTKLEQDINTGKVGMFYGANWNSWWPATTILKTNPKAVFKPYPVPSATNQPAKLGVPWPINTYYAMSSDSKNPEALIKLLNFYLAKDNDNSSQEFLDKYDLNNAWTLSPVAIALPHAFTHSNLITESIKAGDGGKKLPPGVLKEYNPIMDFINKGDPNGYGAWGQIGPESSSQIIQKQYMPNHQIVTTVKTGKAPQDLIDKQATLDKIQVQAFTQIIQGGDLSLFDKFVADWNKAGGAKITEEMNQLYPNK